MTHQSTNRRVSSSLMQRSEIRILAVAYSTEPLPKALGANEGFSRASRTGLNAIHFLRQLCWHTNALLSQPSRHAY
jgi:hypothetical protein